MNRPHVRSLDDAGESQVTGAAARWTKVVHLRVGILWHGHPVAPTGEPSQIGAKEMSCTGSLSVPEIGTVVRCKGSLLGSPTETTGWVKAILSEDHDRTVVIQCIWGAEIAVSVRDFPWFFKGCDSQRAAREYRAGA